MINRIVFILIYWLSISPIVGSQLITPSLDYNQAVAHVGNDGMIFNYAYHPISGYQVPKNSYASLITSMQIWMGGIDNSGILRTAFGPYNPFLSDFSPGPVSTYNMYNTSTYQTAYSESIWVIEKSEILNHIQNHNAPGYIMPESIANWPGNGYYALGVSDQLVPYEDVNSDNVYSPQLGDYPLIKGDKMCYTILNDLANSHIFGGQPTGMEVHIMVYQFGLAGFIDSTTFINVKMVNRLGYKYDEFKFGLNLDSDVGNGGDDYMGCDSLKNLIYAYNMDNDDSGNVSYGLNPPAVGVTCLNEKLNVAGSYRAIDYVGYNLPIAVSEIWNYMNGNWENGDPFLFGGMGQPGSLGVTNLPTKFLFSGNPYSGSGWTELTNNNPIGDRCNFLVVEPFNSSVNNKHCLDFAVLYCRKGNYLENVQGVIDLVDSVRSFAENIDGLICDQVTVGIEESSNESYSIYPNPSSGQFTLVPDTKWSEFELEITDLTGKVIFKNEFNSNEQIPFIVHTTAGIYLLTIQTEDQVFTRNVVIE